MSLKITLAALKILDQENVSPRQLRVMAACDKPESTSANDWVSLSHLKQQTNMPPPSVLRQVQGLIQRDHPLMERRQPGSHRTVAYRRTPLGNKLLKKLDAIKG